MKLDSLIQALLPKDEKFFQYFQRDVENLLKAAQALDELMDGKMAIDQRLQKIRQVDELEHKGDELTHAIFRYLESTFITPFDREDIHTLASKIDDILDFINGAANRIALYKVDTITPGMEALAAYVLKAVEELSNAVNHLSNLKNAKEIRSCLVAIHSIENEADDLFERTIGSLFETCKDPILLIKNKEILVSLETATDQCEDAANVIESIIVKNA
ncbi:MAG: DUF47 family protein [Ignavibacteria bacterium]|nr:DUF47 family protein [Ignavibacteria bacterium]